MRNNVDTIEVDLDSRWDAQTRSQSNGVKLKLANFAAEIRSASVVSSRDRHSSQPWPFSTFTTQLLLPIILARHHSRRHSRNGSDTLYSTIFLWYFLVYINWIRYTTFNNLALHRWDLLPLSKYGRSTVTYFETVTWALHSDAFYTYRHWQIVFRTLNSVSPES